MAAPQDESGDPAEKDRRSGYRHCPSHLFRTRLTISYDGTDFAGWQRQSRAVSIQGTLESALSRIMNRPTVLIGASRTDAGVHALQQVAHFDSPRDPRAFDLRYAIQCLTPPSIVVREVGLAPRDFHAIACATHKIYRYRILNRLVPSALRHRYTYWLRFPLNLEFLNSASRFLVGKQDFKSFQSAGTSVRSTTRTIHSATWHRAAPSVVEFMVSGDGFLKQMVRNIVGTLVSLNQEGAPADRIKAILERGDRRCAGPTAPPQGLFLDSVHYPPQIFQQGIEPLEAVDKR